MTHDTELVRPDKLVQPRQLIYLAVLALAVFVLLPRLVGAGRVLSVIGHANRFYLLLALGCEVIRYFLSASSTHLLARLFGRKVPYSPLLETFFAGGAANRIVSTGGAPGMVIRAVFLARQELSLGSVGVLFLIEDLAGLVVGGAISLMGVAVLVGIGRSRALLTGAGGLLTLVVLVAVGVYLYRRRTLLEQSIHTAVRTCSAVSQRLIGRAFYDPAHVQCGIENFYTGVSAAWRKPSYTAIVFILNLLRYLAGAVSLYFAFLALNWTLSPVALVLLFTSASMVSSISAMPAEAAIMGTGFAILSLSFGVPKDIAMAALLASRTIYFWLPIPLGALAFWNLRRRHYL